jgi:protocatechuate 3,4-dioxygenase beta subunit
MKRSLLLRPAPLLLMLFLTANGDQTPGAVNQQKNCIDLQPGQKGFIQLAKTDEPGEPLLIYGKVIDRKTNQPVRDVSIFLYQTDSSGIYNLSGGADDQARIRGTVYGNESGCFKIKTILPGDYPGQKNSRHLHYVMNAKGYKEEKSILFFKGFTTANITGNGPLMVLDINKENDGTWIGTANLYMEKTQSETP